MATRAGAEELPDAATVADALTVPNGRRRELVTSVPEVSCAVCERRLLRGERPESFLAGSQVQLVCELCGDRARQAGWVRASDAGPAPRELYTQRSRSSTLLERLRRKRAGEQRRASRSTRDVP
jgi:hypothetical protein